MPSVLSAESMEAAKRRKGLGALLAAAFDQLAAQASSRPTMAMDGIGCVSRFRPKFFGRSC